MLLEVRNQLPGRVDAYKMVACIFGYDYRALVWPTGLSGRFGRRSANSGPRSVRGVAGRGCAGR